MTSGVAPESSIRNPSLPSRLRVEDGAADHTYFRAGILEEE